MQFALLACSTAMVTVIGNNSIQSARQSMVCDPVDLGPRSSLYLPQKAPGERTLGSIADGLFQKDYNMYKK